MRVNEIVADSEGLSYSFEVFPQMNSRGRSIFDTVTDMSRLSPQFISVTYGAGGNGRGDLIRLCDHIESLGITPLPHFTVVGHSEVEARNILSRYRDHRFENVLALRGDPPRGYRGPIDALFHDFRYCSELVEFISRGFDTCVGAAVYPEGRTDCSWEDNLRYSRLKESVGAEFFVSQLFFENDHFQRFVEESGLGVPVIPGILPIFGPRQLEMARDLAGAHIPRRLAERVMRYRDDPESMRAAGIAYAAGQIVDLAERGFDFVHIFTLNRYRDTVDLLREVGVPIDRTREVGGKG